MASNFIVRWEVKLLDKGQEKDRAGGEKGFGVHRRLFLKDTLENYREHRIQKRISSIEDQIEIGDHKIL